MSKDKFLKGALILTVAGVVVKIIGSVNRILLSRLLGGEGIGLYQMAYPIYLLAISISSAGIPVAISIMVSERVALGDYRGANRVFKISLAMLVVTGLFFTGLLFYGARWLIDNQLVRDPRAYYAIVALAPALFFVTLLSSYRGYFQGLQFMIPTGVSQIMEQLLRVVTMIGLAYWLLPRGLEFAAAGASFGAGPGAVAALVVLMIYYWRHSRILRERVDEQSVDIIQESTINIVKRIIRLALPVLMASIMVPIVENIDLFIVPVRLEAAGFSIEQATEQFGYLTGMAIPLIAMATIPTLSMAASLVPAISESFTLGNREAIYQRTATAMRLTNLVVIPAFVGMGLLAEPISKMLYGTPQAGVSIAILSLGIVLLGWQQVTTGILQGLGHINIPLLTMLAAAVVKIVLNWVLTAIPALGIKGAAWATNADFLVAALLNMYFIQRYVGFRMDLKETAKAVVAAALMGVTVHFSFAFILQQVAGKSSLATLAAILIGGLVYFLALVLLGGVEARDIERIPKAGKLLVLVLRKIRLLRD
ncbi:polysaccharide biosynthesis protein [Azotosporobacter soli]|uniref:putative polysaccharide biosynthesis protein n=1 Tax=Azotosporobacter soli TaxID=3055040 RepID=UPI0031FF0DDF